MPEELTVGEKREKALKTFMERYEREEDAVAAWEDYCKKSGLLAEDSEPDEPPEPAETKTKTRKPKDR